MKKTLIISAAIASISFAGAHAHVPGKCQPLMEEAGKQNDLFTKAMMATAEEAMGNYDFGALADEFAQALGAYGPFAVALTEAITCTRDN